MAFERDDLVDVDAPEPFGSLLAFLSDLDEQAEIMGLQLAPDPFAAQIVAALRARLTAIGLVVRLASEQRRR